MPSKAIFRGTASTPSERYLAHVADKTFLNLWSYPSPYFDKKMGGKGDGKELCDLLVVCGDDVIIFSDKMIGWKDSGDVMVSWKRWKRAAIDKSVAQVHGAARILSEFPDRIYTDKSCLHKFPLDFPSPDRMRLHGVCIALGAEGAARKYWKDDDGSLIIASDGELNGAVELPFSVSDEGRNGMFCHIFDETSFNVVLGELNTISDLLPYLKDREKLIRGKKLLMAHSEKDLLAFYKLNEDATGKGSFNVSSGKKGKVNRKMTSRKNKISEMLAVQSGWFSDLMFRPEYLQKKLEDQANMEWDNLITAFTDHVINGTNVSLFETEPSVKLSEFPLRLMAMEPRVARRALSKLIKGAVKTYTETKENRLARVIYNKSSNARVAYVFMILERGSSGEEVAYETYRGARTAYLTAYCEAVSERYREVNYVVGIAVDGRKFALSHSGGSEDLVAIGQREWTDDEVFRLKEKCAEWSILVSEKMSINKYSEFEFPAG